MVDTVKVIYKLENSRVHMLTSVHMLYWSLHIVYAYAAKFQQTKI